MCSPLLWLRVGGTHYTFACGRGGGGGPIPTMGQTLVYSGYIHVLYVLCAANIATVQCTVYNTYLCVYVIALLYTCVDIGSDRGHEDDHRVEEDHHPLHHLPPVHPPTQLVRERTTFASFFKSSLKISKANPSNRVLFDIANHGSFNPIPGGY
jgi:hypothetical protein